MEMIADYTPPTSWTDKGMNWEAPDPRRFDYLYAISAAILERTNAVYFPMRTPYAPPFPTSLMLSPSSLPSVSPYSFFNSIFYHLDLLCKKFVSVSGQEPLPLSFDALCEEENLVRIVPFSGHRTAEYASLLSGLKRVLDRLLYSRLAEVSCTKRFYFGGGGSAKSSIPSAWEYAADNVQERSGVSSNFYMESSVSFYGTFPNTIYCHIVEMGGDIFLTNASQIPARVGVITTPPHKSNLLYDSCIFDDLGTGIEEGVTIYTDVVQPSLSSQILSAPSLVSPQLPSIPTDPYTTIRCGYCCWPFLFFGGGDLFQFCPDLDV